MPISLLPKTLNLAASNHQKSLAAYVKNTDIDRVKIAADASTNFFTGFTTTGKTSDFRCRVTGAQMNTVNGSDFHCLKVSSATLGMWLMN